MPTTRYLPLAAVFLASSLHLGAAPWSPVAPLAAGTAPRQSVSVPFASDRGAFAAADQRLERHLERESLRLQGGVARLDDLVFADGVIEVDIAFTPERGFSGVFWRMQDAANYETFYLRPHQSGNPAVKSASDNAPAWFSNFRYVRSEGAPTAVDPPRGGVAPGTITAWRVSSTFAENRVETGERFPEDLRARLEWTDLDADTAASLTARTMSGR